MNVEDYLDDGQQVLESLFAEGFVCDVDFVFELDIEESTSSKMVMASLRVWMAMTLLCDIMIFLIVLIIN